MIKNNLLKLMVILFLLLPVAFLGCSGGSGGDDAPVLPGTASIRVLPAVYDFGIVTTGNAPAPLEVEIQNKGSVTLNVDSIGLWNDTHFHLDLTLGSNPCSGTSPSIAPGGNCTGEVVFNPQWNNIDPFITYLEIKSNDPNNSTLNIELSGRSEDVSGLNVRINQIEACPRPGVVTAYVSVTDQGGYPITGLTAADFMITEAAPGVYNAPPDNPIIYVGGNATLSAVLVMDYSGSITDVQDNVDDMEESAADFVDQLGAGDEAAIIKFDNDVVVVQSFTSDKGDLEDAISAPYDNGRDTSLFDAVEKAVDEIVDSASKVRKAVIVITDGKDNDSIINRDPLVAYAVLNDVPLFTVGLGDLTPDSIDDLKYMANETGGHYYESATSDNLRTIYQQLADVLFQDSYILTYTSGLGALVTADLTIEATLPALPGSPGEDTKEITSCP